VPFHQLSEALDDLSETHRILAESYRKVGEGVAEPRAARLCQLIEKEELAVCESLESFKSSAPADMLAAWLQYMPVSQVSQIRRSVALWDRQVSLNAVLEDAVSTNEELRKLYRQLASVVSASRIRELFSNIEQFELAKISRLATSTTASELISRTK
jgi:hypothetical protein